MPIGDGVALPSKKKLVTYGKSTKKRFATTPQQSKDRGRLPGDDSSPSISYRPGAGPLKDVDEERDDTVHIPGQSKPLTSIQDGRAALEEQPRGGLGPGHAAGSEAPKKRKLDNEPLSRLARNESPMSLATLPTSLPLTKKAKSGAAPKVLDTRTITQPAESQRFEPTTKKQSNVPYGGQPRSQISRTEPDRRHADSRADLGGRLATKVARRPRLIDTLAAQVEESSDSDSDTSSKPTGGSFVPSISSLGPASRQSPVKEAPEKDIRTPQPQTRHSAGPKVRSVKHTYSQQRSMLASSQFSGDIEPSGSSDLFAATGRDPFSDGFPKLQLNRSLSFSDDDEDDDALPAGAIRSVHELRQAGANNRFADEVDDLFQRIGKPGVSHSTSMRRNALLELSSRLQQKSFARQLRDHGVPRTLFVALDDEQDLISGHAMACVVLSLLASSTAPHLVSQLHADGLSSLLARLLRTGEDISVVARDRKFNMSKSTQASLVQVKTAILRLPVWEPLRSTKLSPRTVALKLLDMYSQSSDNVDEGAVTDHVADILFEITASYASPGYWDDPSEQDVVDSHLASAILERHSVQAMSSHQADRWTDTFLPSVAGMLTAVLKRPIDQFGDFERTILKLALNTTNNNPEAAGAFGDNEMLLGLADSISQGFDILYHESGGTFQSEVFNSLILMLGVMINFMEHCPSIRVSASALATEGSSLERLMNIFLENYTSTSEADSVEKTQLNVAFGYLAVLLGYLSLSGPVRERFSERNDGKGVGCLVESIREFIALHRTLADTKELTLRLQELVEKIEND